MIEKVKNLAEKLATHISLSRRGFLARLGQTAAAAAGVVGGLLAVSQAAQAANRGGYCQIQQTRNGNYYYNGNCVNPYSCAFGYSNVCRGGALSGTRLCGSILADLRKPCTF
jgi:hypothetical protein